MPCCEQLEVYRLHGATGDKYTYFPQAAVGAAITLSKGPNVMPLAPAVAADAERFDPSLRASKRAIGSIGICLREGRPI